MPKVVKGPIGGVADLEKITVLPGDQGVFAEQIEVIQKMKAGLNEDIPMFQTMMCPTSVLQKLCAVNPIGRYRAASRDDLMMTLMHEQPERIHKTCRTSPIRWPIILSTSSRMQACTVCSTVPPACPVPPT